MFRRASSTHLAHQGRRASTRTSTKPAYNMVKDSFATIDFTATGCKYTQDDEFLEALELDRQRGELTQIVEESNVFKVLHHWAGTILNEVIYDAVFWMTLIVRTILVLALVIVLYY